MKDLKYYHSLINELWHLIKEHYNKADWDAIDIESIAIYEKYNEDPRIRTIIMWIWDEIEEAEKNGKDKSGS